MDNHTELSKRELPKTARVSTKVIEYYQNFRQDSNLEKYMRLYSPASSQDSQKGSGCMPTLDLNCKQTKRHGKISSSNSCETLGMTPSRPLGVSDDINCKSLPNIVVHDQSTSEKSNSPPNNVIVDITIEAEPKKEKDFSASTENLKTPKKSFKSTKTQTPESVAKIHKRLEWDSLGDVGYKKSMSTSNISTMERSLLREFFKETSIISAPETTAAAGENQHLKEKNKTVKKSKAAEVEHSTPPLASSTLVTTSKSGARPKMISQSTSSTSLNEKFEKYAQTSLIKPTAVCSQEIQCTISCSNSVLEGTATPSSFEYQSSRSSKSRSSKSSDFHIDENTQKQTKTLNHPFITSITDLLIKRKALGEKNQQKRHQFNSIRELQTKFQAALDENKENHSHSAIDSSTTISLSLSKQAPELDLGIQLICALVDAKSINVKQKRQLIHDIIKRITDLGAKAAGTVNSTSISSSGGTTTNSSDCQLDHIYDSVRSNIHNRNKQETMNKFKVASELVVSPLTAEQVITQENPSTSTTNTSEDNREISGSAKEFRNHKKSKPFNFSKSHHFQQHQSTQLPYKKNLIGNSQKENNAKVPSTTAAPISKETQSELIVNERGRDESTSKRVAVYYNLNPEKLETKYTETTKEKKINRCTQTSKTSTTSTSSTTTPDLTTQRLIVATNNEINKSSTDAEQPTMREWLNPLTQSEIEYEERKEIEMKKTAAAHQDKLQKKSQHDCGRVQQINWIENEIKRLMCLKHLLLKDDSTSLSSLKHSVSKDFNKVSTQTDKLYDIVYSDKSSALSGSVEQLVQEIEIILEESHEDIINLKDNIKSTKDRKKETQIMYGKEKDPIKTKPKFRTITENINFYEEQLLNGKKAEVGVKQRKQREKIDTPPSTDKSQESERSLKDMVQQRKREFIEAYRTKKQHHYEVLKQQQKQDLNYLNTQSKLNDKSAITTDSEHYSLPHTLPRKYLADELSFYTQHPLPLTPPEKEAKLKLHHTLGERIIYKTTSGGQQTNAKSKSSTSSTITTTSSSMFCMSSDVSVPMGSQNSSSVPTTTHQYDDVANAAAVTGVSVQTSDSISRTKPIYGPKPSLPSMPFVDTSSTIAACIQVKPKGIAYVIEFDDNKNASDADINSNNNRIKSKSKVTNSSKSSPSIEPPLTLQDHLEKNKPTFLKHSRERKAVLNKLQILRQERDRQLREIIDNTSFNSLDRRLQYLPPPATQKVRILKTKDMKALTNKCVARLSEVVAKHEREIEEKKRRSNRILRDLFNRRLQKRVRSGKLSLNHSKTVI